MYEIDIIKTNLTLGEGPHWIAEEKAIYLNDIKQGKIIRIDSKTNQITSTCPKENYPISFVLPVKDKKNQFVIGCKNDILLIHWNGEEGSNCTDIVKLTSLDSGDRINDGKADIQGRLWTGTMGKQKDTGLFEDHQGKFYVYESGKEPKVLLNDVGISNGIAWSNDNQKMYYIDSLRFRVDSFDYNLQTAVLTNQKTVFNLKENNIKGFPDGMTIDQEGMLWIACFDGAQVIRIDPNKSKLLQQIPLPALNITSVAFGGENYDELWVTSAVPTRNIPEENKLYPEGGNVFRIKNIGVCGMPNYKILV